MKNLLGVLILCFAAQGAAALAAVPEKPASAASAGFEVIRADFGLLDFTGSQPKFVPAKVVPHVIGQSYGWVIALRNEKSTVLWREELTLPRSPGSWGRPDPMGSRKISADGKTAITQNRVSPPRGLISNAWTIAPGDPRGHYVIKVFVDGTLAKVFEFDVR